MKENHSRFDDEGRMLRAIPLNISHYCDLLGLNQEEGVRLVSLARNPLFSILTTQAKALFEVRCKDSYDCLKLRQRVTLHLFRMASGKFAPCSVPFAVAVALMAMDVTETLQGLQWEAESQSKVGEDSCGRN